MQSITNTTPKASLEGRNGSHPTAVIHVCIKGVSPLFLKKHSHASEFHINVNINSNIWFIRPPLFLNFCSLFVLPVSTFATSKPSDANGKNVVKEEKTCPSGQYLNPEISAAKEISPAKNENLSWGLFSKRKNQSLQQESSSQNLRKLTQNRKSLPILRLIVLIQKIRMTKLRSQPKDCLPGYFLNKITGRCNKRASRKRLALKAPSAIKSLDAAIKFKLSLRKPCHADQYRNPKTGRCHKMATSTIPKTCPAGKVLNPVTNRCKGEEKPHEIKACKEGYERNDQTHRCRKVHQNTGASNPVEVPKLGDKKKEQKKDFNGTTAVAGSAAVGLGICYLPV